MPIYAREGVKRFWLVDPVARTLEVYGLERERWLLLGTWRDDAKVRAEPFAEFELELSGLWARAETGVSHRQTRAISSQ